MQLESVKEQIGQGWTFPSHPLTNFETQKYYQNVSRFNEISYRGNLPNKMKDAAYAINLDEYSDIGTHWIAFYLLKIMLLTLIVFVQNILQKKLRNF